MSTLKSETKSFSAEIGRLLHLMINALYTNKDTCIRELISNASDACDKLRHLAQLDSSCAIQQPEPKIIIRIDSDKKTLSVKDFGIGMNKDDLLKDLGTIASSGTERFLAQMDSDVRQDSSLIGQFGVGFYSVFMIADRVEVKTRKAGEEQSYLWTSDGSAFFTIMDSEERYEGTEIIAHIKAAESNYLDLDYVKNIILRYSDNIAVPIFLEKSSGDSEQVNSAKGLWTLNRSQISQEQYKEFYQNSFYASDAPWKILHNKNEGSGSFINLLFIPSARTFDLFSSERKRRVKLYVKRVFVTEDGVDLIPYYLRFVRGIVDTDALPLNISREMIQSSPVLATIRRVVVTRVLKELKGALDSCFDEYKNFWLNFGAVLKEGLCEDALNIEHILDLCLFYSATQREYVTLAQYLDKAPENQKSIYYITGESLKSLSESPQIEGFLKWNVDVLLMVDTVDSFWLSMVSHYKNISFVSVVKANLDIEAISSSAAVACEISCDQFEGLCKYFKECLGDLVRDVQISKKLVNSPACLMIQDGAMDGRMERFLLAQNHIDKISAKIMEINFNHSVIKQINDKVQAGNCDQHTKDLVLILFDQILLVEGEPIKDVKAFCDRVNNLISHQKLEDSAA